VKPLHLINSPVFVFIAYILGDKNIASSKQFQKIYQKDFERRYMFHKNLLANLPKDFNPDFQDGDGDCAMT
jgi:hypothetical protein